MTVNEGGDSFLVSRQKVRPFPDQSVWIQSVEVLIRNHPDVDGVCMLAVSDPYGGKVFVALVVLGGGAKERVAKDNKETRRPPSPS